MVTQAPATATPSPIAAFLSTKTGLSSAVITTAFAIGAPIVTHMVTHKSAYDEGQADYAEALRDGTAELDGKVVEIVDAAAQKRAIADARADARAEAMAEASAQFTLELEQNNAAHSREIRRQRQRTYTPAETAWRDVLVPGSTGVRFNQIDAQREDGGGRNERTEIEAGRTLAGYPAVDGTPGGSDEWRP